MATTLEFAQYVCGQLAGAGEVRYRKMFGEYSVYIDDKLPVLICDNQVFLKITEGGRKLLAQHNSIKEGHPYEGAKPCFLIEELENKEFLKNLVQTTCKELPAPKPKKKPKNKEKE